MVNESVLLNGFHENAYQMERDLRGKLARGHANWGLWLAAWHPPSLQSHLMGGGVQTQYLREPGNARGKTRERRKPHSLLFSLSHSHSHRSRSHNLSYLSLTLIFIHVSWWCYHYQTQGAIWFLYRSLCHLESRWIFIRGIGCMGENIIGFHPIAQVYIYLREVGLLSDIWYLFYRYR